MKYLLQGVEKIGLVFKENLRYSRFHFKSSKMSQLITFISRYSICLKRLVMLILLPNLIQIGPFNRPGKGKTSQKVLSMESPEKQFSASFTQKVFFAKVNAYKNSK